MRRTAVAPTPGRSLAGVGNTPRGGGALAITAVSWDALSRIEDAVESDLWPPTWSDDGHQYMVWGDGAGFQDVTKRSYGIARVEGAPESYVATDLFETAEQQDAGKVSGIISIGGVLYMWRNNQDVAHPGLPTHQLIKSTDKGVSVAAIAGHTWPRAGATSMVPTSFVNQGQDNAEAVDGFVYHVAADWLASSPVYLLRCPVAQIEDPAAYEVFSSADPATPTWSSTLSDRQPIYSEPTALTLNGAAHTTIGLIPATGEFLLFFHHDDDVGKWSIQKGPNPWGPWTELDRYTDWCGLAGPISDMLPRYIAPKWIGPVVGGAIDFWIVWSGTGGAGDVFDRFNATKGTLTVEAA